MITAIRRYMKALHIFLWLVVGSLIVTTFFVWGKGSLGGDASDGVAVVNGETIPAERYQRLYQAYVNRYSQMYPERFSPEMADRLGLRQQVVNDLVQEVLIVQRAEAEGFGVTDEELNTQIQAIAAFHVNGVFSAKVYQDFLRRRGTSPTTFEADARRDTTRLKAETAIKSGVKVSDAEVDQAFVYRKERVRAAWALVDLPAIMPKTTAPDAEIDAYLKGNPTQFQRPERRRVQFVLLDSKDGVKPIPDADVEKYYNERAKEFETPRQVQAAHVLVRVPETGGSEAEARAKAKTEDVIRRAKAGEDFAKLARKVSEDQSTAAKGGDLGWITKGQVVPQFEQTVFALKKGDVSTAPVRTQFGYHAIKVLDIREGGRKPMKEVAPQIRVKLITEAMEKSAMAKAGEIRPVLQAAKDFAAEARRLGFESRESIINRVSGFKGLDRTEGVQEVAFGIAIGGVSPPVKTPAGVVILKVVEQLPAGVPPLADIKDEVANAVKRKKADALAAERAKKLAAEARSGDLIQLAKKDGLQTAETSLFSRGQPADKLPTEAMVAALQTAVGTIAEPVKGPQGYYVVKTLERVAPDPADLVKEREQIGRELLEVKRGQAWESWVLGAREKAKIELSGRMASAR